MHAHTRCLHVVGRRDFSGTSAHMSRKMPKLTPAKYWLHSSCHFAHAHKFNYCMGGALIYKEVFSAIGVISHEFAPFSRGLPAARLLSIAQMA